MAAFEYGVVPFVARASTEASFLAHVSWLELALAAALEVASLAAYTRLTQVLFTPPYRLSFTVQFRIDVAGYGMSHAVPGGGLAGVGLRVRLMADRGIPGAVVLALSAAQGALAILGLLVVWLIGLLMTAPRTGVTESVALLLTATVLTIVLVEGATRRPATLSRIAVALERGLTFVTRQRWRDSLNNALMPLEATLGAHRTTAAGVFWSAANWLLDATSLWVALRAFEATVPFELLLAAYGLPNALAMLPITLGGVGIVEALLTPAVIATGTTAGGAVAGVLTWRLLQYWIPMPAGALCWASLALTSRPNRRGHSTLASSSATRPSSPGE